MCLRQKELVVQILCHRYRSIHNYRVFHLKGRQNIELVAHSKQKKVYKLNCVKKNITKHCISWNFSKCRIQAEAVMIAKGLHYFNSFLNPIIYTLMNQQFKTAFKHLFKFTYSNLTGKVPSMTKSEIDRQLSISTRTRGISYLKSKSSTHDKTNGTTTEEWVTCQEKALQSSSQ